MQRVAARFGKSDLAKYPFLKETSEYVKRLDFKIEDLSDPEFAKILERAEERVQEAILYTLISRKTHDEDIEILSFPIAVMVTASTGNPFIMKRYALAEAKQTYEDLKSEPKERLMTIAANFKWKLAQLENAKPPLEFALSFVNFLRNTPNLKDKKWRLVNRPLVNGFIHLSRDEVARLLSEEVRTHIERAQAKEALKLPETITNIVNRIKKLSSDRIGEAEVKGFPKVIEQGAFPPCVQTLYEAFSSGRHLSHIGRFTLTSFLVNIGMPPETVIDLYKGFSDFNQRMTRYQVEHIAGTKGSRTFYTPPKCETLRTHGICTGSNDECRHVYHPLSYYRRRATKTG